MSRIGFTIASITAAMSAALVLSACGTPGSSSGGQPSADMPSQTVNSSLHDQLPASIQSAGEINFAVQQHPPYTTVSGNDLSGPNIDLQNALAGILGVKAKSTVVGGDLSAALAGLLSGRYDIFGGPVEATPDREQQYDEIGWLISQTAYLVDKSSGNVSVDQLCGKTVAYVSGSVIAGYTKNLSDYCTNAGKEKINGTGLADTNATILAVKSGRAAGAGTTLDSGNAAAKADTSLGVVIQPEQAGGVKQNNCLITPKSSKLGPVIQQAMQQLIDNGTYGKILAKWGLTPSAVKMSVLNPPLEAS